MPSAIPTAPRLLGQTSRAGLFQACLEPSHGRKEALTQANWRSNMRLSQVSSKALPALQGWEPHVLGAQRELTAIPSIVVILPSRELRDPQELISKMKQKKEEKCSPGYTAACSLMAPRSASWVPPPQRVSLARGWLGIESRGVGASTLLPCCTSFHFQPTLPPPTPPDSHGNSL